MISKPMDYNSNKSSILLQNDRLIETFWPVPVRLKTAYTFDESLPSESFLLLALLYHSTQQNHRQNQAHCTPFLKYFYRRNI
ncbi:hypothetical protein C1T21_21915 [Paenibacillus sp. F4]|nr:hypothetical protein C1T21_21915 [Paenibacillus sp. F4]